MNPTETVLPSRVQRQAEEIAEFDRKALEAVTPAPTLPVDPPAPAPVTTPAPPLVETNVDEQRWKTLQGMYNQSRQAIERLEAQNTELRQRIEARPVEIAPPPEALVKPADTEAFGEDLIALMRRVAKDEITPMISDRVGAVEAKVTATQAKLGAVDQTFEASRREAFFRDLTVVQPDWEAINANPDWLGWLAQVDPLSGTVRQAHLDTAIGSLSLQRTKALFDAFLGGAQAPAPAAPQTRAEALAGQVAPTTTRAAMPAAGTTTLPTFSQAEISRFYEDARKGRFAGRAKELRETETQIELAVQQGRITP